ncbi:MAG: cell filamentation protein Fic, partial [Bacteroidota bacterium]
MSDMQEKLLDYLVLHPSSSSGDIYEGLQRAVSVATVKRLLVKLRSEDYVLTKGKGKGTKYHISRAYSLFYPIDIDKYFEKEI